MTLSVVENLIEGAYKSKGLLSKVYNILLEMLSKADQYKAKWEQDLGLTCNHYRNKGKNSFPFNTDFHSLFKLDRLHPISELLNKIFNPIPLVAEIPFMKCKCYLNLMEIYTPLLDRIHGYNL